VPAENVHVVGDDVIGLACFPTPGHASHHVSYLAADGTLYAGDAAGVRLVPSRFVIPVSPPPDFDAETWERTLMEIEARAPRRLALIHFGVAGNVADHLQVMRAELRRWVERVGAGATEEEFVAAGRADLAARVPEDPDDWERAAPLWQSFRGLERYWQKRREVEAS
jgi:glyoxylase-like metal-dependent hydrolase (beta-lactamase superfamily II)